MNNEHQDTLRKVVWHIATDIVKYRKLTGDLLHEQGMESRSYKEAWKTLKALELSQSVLELALL